MPEKINSEELIQLLQETHKETLEKYQAAEKAMLEIPEMKSQMQTLEQQLARKGGGGAPGGGDEVKSIGQQLVESNGFKSFLESGGSTPTRIQVKAVGTIGSGAGYAGPMIAPMTITEPVALPRRRMTVRQLLAPGQTESNTIFFPKMIARYSNAAATAESAAKPLSGFDMVQASAPVRTIAHYMQLTRQSLDDAPSLRGLVDSELNYGLQLAEENEFLAGDGTGQHILGLIPQAAAFSAPFAVTGETGIDRVALALIQAENALLPASGIVLNTLDWGKFKMLKDAQGRYILGPPNSNAQQILWGLPVVSTPAIPVNTFLVGAFETAAQIFDRMLVEILLSTEHNVNFTTNEITVRGEERLAMICRRPAAFITGTLP